MSVFQKLPFWWEKLQIMGWGEGGSCAEDTMKKQDMGVGEGLWPGWSGKALGVGLLSKSLKEASSLFLFIDTLAPPTACPLWGAHVPELMVHGSAWMLSPSSTWEHLPLLQGYQRCILSHSFHIFPDFLWQTLWLHHLRSNDRSLCEFPLSLTWQMSCRLHVC